MGSSCSLAVFSLERNLLCFQLHRPVLWVHWAPEGCRTKRCWSRKQMNCSRSLRLWLPASGESAGTGGLQYPRRCEPGNRKGQGHHLLGSKTNAGRPWAGLAVPSEASGKAPSQSLSPRRTLVTGRKTEGWQVPRRSSLTHIHEIDQGWRQAKVTQRQCLCAFQKSLET